MAQFFFLGPDVDKTNHLLMCPAENDENSDENGDANHTRRWQNKPFVNVPSSNVPMMRMMIGMNTMMIMMTIHWQNKPFVNEPTCQCIAMVRMMRTTIKTITDEILEKFQPPPSLPPSGIYFCGFLGTTSWHLWSDIASIYRKTRNLGGACFTSSFAPYERSGHVNHATMRW